MTVRNDPQEQLFDHDYTKDNSKILCSTHKMKISNSLSTTVFSKHKVQDESGAFGTNFSNTFFFLPPTVDRIEKINKYLGSVNHNVVDIDKNELGENFNPSVLYSMGDERNAARKSILNVLKKVVDHSSQNLKRNADGYSASVPHNNDTLLWPGGKRTQSHKFALSY